MKRASKKILIPAVLALALIFYLVLRSGQVPRQNVQLQVSESLFSGLQTDRAAYKPGEKVHFSLNSRVNDAQLSVTYYHLDQKIGGQTLPVTKGRTVGWNWQPPGHDFSGYLALVILQDSRQVQRETIGVDVSSDWSKFPRYGFLSNFQAMTEAQIQSAIDQLNRYHINGIQFYDWSEKHHQPVTVNNGSIPATWTDIAGRPVDSQTVHAYIDAAHARGMKAMSYNLLYGALANSEQDGTQRGWFLFKDPNHNQVDVNPLPTGWKSDIYLMNPADPGWQNYLIGQQKKVYRYLPFDGWHVDQLGDRGTVYDENSHVVPLQNSFSELLNQIRCQTPGKDLVMNAVGQFGQQDIASADVNFLYSEVWDQTPSYGDLRKIIDANSNYSGDRKSSVLAAYMDYRKSDGTGTFNTPGVLLTDSVIFASGGDHIELGEHMLSKEYFPFSHLAMSSDLQNRITHYYDFLTAYENLLRDGAKNEPIDVHSEELLPLSADPQQGHIWTFARQKGNQTILHLINFLDARSMNWRDTDGTQTKPATRRDLNFTAAEKKNVKKIWLASPDYKNGIPVSLPFQQKGGAVHLNVPSFEYWDMIVFDY